MDFERAQVKVVKEVLLTLGHLKFGKVSQSLSGQVQIFREECVDVFIQDFLFLKQVIVSQVVVSKAKLKQAFDSAVAECGGRYHIYSNNSSCIYSFRIMAWNDGRFYDFITHNLEKTVSRTRSKLVTSVFLCAKRFLQ